MRRNGSPGEPTASFAPSGLAANSWPRMRCSPRTATSSGGCHGYFSRSGIGRFGSASRRPRSKRVATGGPKSRCSRYFGSSSSEQTCPVAAAAPGPSVFGGPSPGPAGRYRTHQTPAAPPSSRSRSRRAATTQPSRRGTVGVGTFVVMAGSSSPWSFWFPRSAWERRCDALRRGTCGAASEPRLTGTQSVPTCVPTRSVGTRDP